jgi:hypothetical protein
MPPRAGHCDLIVGISFYGFTSTVLVRVASSLLAQDLSVSKRNPHIIVVGVNGMEMDVIRPLVLKGDLPNLERVIKNGVRTFLLCAHYESVWSS